MENCAIYSHYLNFEEVIAIVQSNLPKAKIETQEEGLNKSLNATIKGGFFSKAKTLTINYRERLNPSYQLQEVECGLTQNLAGMANFIQSIPTQQEALRNKFLHKVLAANCEMGFVAEPNITKDFEPILRKIIQSQDAFIFAQAGAFFNTSPNQHFVDKNLNLILDTAGNTAVEDIDVRIDPKYFDSTPTSFSQEQLDRKAASEAFLKEQGVKINSNLPCIPAVEEIQLRSKAELIERAYCLFTIAVKGEGLEQEKLEKFVAEKQISDFSPKEILLYNSAQLTEQERLNATWRYESLYTLLWVLGKEAMLNYPNVICDVPAIASQFVQPSRAAFEESVQLRSAQEILDELDKTYRMHWTCVDARIQGHSPTGNLEPGIVYERHYALNWITNYGNQDWDDISTDT